VLAERGDNPYRAYSAAADLAQWVRQDDWADTLIAYARCKRIVRPLAESFELAPDRYGSRPPVTCMPPGRVCEERLSRGSVAALARRCARCGPPSTVLRGSAVMADDPDLRAARLRWCSASPPCRRASPT